VSTQVRAAVARPILISIMSEGGQEGTGTTQLRWPGSVLELPGATLSHLQGRACLPANSFQQAWPADAAAVGDGPGALQFLAASHWGTIARIAQGAGPAPLPAEGATSRFFSSGSGGVLDEPRLGEGQKGSEATGENTSGESLKKQAGRNEATDGGWRDLEPDEQCGGSWLVDKRVQVYWEDDKRFFLPRQPLLLSLESLEMHTHCSILSA